MVLAACVLLAFWWIMRRTVPEHAVRIPANAPLVLTLNLRALGLDILLGGSVEDTVKHKEEPAREDDDLKKAIEQNGGHGLSWRKDVLCFVQADSSQPQYFAAVIVLSDAETFGGLASGYLAKRFGSAVKKDGALQTLYADSLGLLLGWNENELLLLKKLQGDSAFLHGELKKLFAQTGANSLLSNADFRAHQLEDFDAALWVNMKQGRVAGRLEKYGWQDQNLASADYLHLLLQFRDGEARLLQKNISANAARKIEYDTEPLLFHKPAQLSASWNGRLPDEKQFAKSPLGHWLQEQSGEAAKWRSALKGNFSLAVHDTIHYTRTYITFDYDENFEQTQVQRSVPEMMPGFTACFPVNDRAQLEILLKAWQEKDSLQLKNGALRLPGDLPAYLKLQDSLLVLGTHPGKQLELQPRGALAASKGEAVRAFIDMPKLLSAYPADSLDVRARLQLERWQRWSRELTFSVSLPQGNMLVSEMRLRFAEENVNGLVQLMKILRGTALE